MSPNKTNHKWNQGSPSWLLPALAARKCLSLSLSDHLSGNSHQWPSCKLTVTVYSTVLSRMSWNYYGDEVEATPQWYDGYAPNWDETSTRIRPLMFSLMWPAILKMAISARSVGFECEFVEEPPQWLQTECPICLHILREPYQVTCCGKSFCRLCIERVKGSNKPCPCCNEDDFNDFPNKGLQQPLYGFKIYCSEKEKGCDWKGELGKLDDHLNLNPQDDKELEGCKFAKIECSYCSDIIVRSKLLDHKNAFCDKRPFNCEYCNEYKSTFEDVTHNHWPVCSCYPVRCPNKCGSFPERQKLDDHVGKECPLTVVECDFHYAGCEVRLPRRNMPDHLKDGLVAHFSLLAVSHKQQQEEIQALIKQVKQLKLHTPIIPVDFIVENPYEHDIFDLWSSMSFYTHCQGYKLSLDFFYFGDSFTFYFCLMQGEFDGHLKWPLKAVIDFTLLHQQEKGDDYESSVELNHNECLKDEASTRCGTLTIQRTIIDQYTHNNCLHFKIVDVHF